VNALHLLVRMAENNAWSNLRLLRACARLALGEYEATRTSFFPSIRQTLEHLHLVDAYYLDALEGGDHGRALYAAPDPTFATVELLAVAQHALDRRLVAFVRSLPDEAALEHIAVMQRPAEDQRERVGDVLQHLFVHQVHHRGQAHAMLAGTSVKPPQLDEFFMASELPLRADELRDLGLPER